MDRWVLNRTFDRRIIKEALDRFLKKLIQISNSIFLEGFRKLLGGSIGGDELDLELDLDLGRNTWTVQASPIAIHGLEGNRAQELESGDRTPLKPTVNVKTATRLKPLSSSSLSEEKSSKGSPLRHESQGNSERSERSTGEEVEGGSHNLPLQQVGEGDTEQLLEDSQRGEEEGIENMVSMRAFPIF